MHMSGKTRELEALAIDFDVVGFFDRPRHGLDQLIILDGLLSLVFLGGYRSVEQA